MQIIDMDRIDVTARGSRHVVGVSRDADGPLKRGELCGLFDGVNTLLDYVATEQPRPRREESSAQDAEPGFNSFATYNEAMSIYRSDPSRVRNFVEADLDLTDADDAGRAITWSVTGDFLDVGRYLEGEPEAFGVMADGNPRSRRVNLLINVDAVCIMPADVINARGRRLQRLVDWLEARSVRTAITASTSTGCAHIEVVVKQHDEPLDLNDLAVISHGDFLRRIVFRFMEYSDTWRPGYGSPLHLNDHLRGADLTPAYGHEVTVLCSNQIPNLAAVETEFDKTEKQLAAALSAPVIEPEEGVMRMFTGGSSWPF